MLFDFPPSQLTGNLPLTIGIHVMLVIAALMPLFFVWVKTNKPARKSEM